MELRSRAAISKPRNRCRGSGIERTCDHLHYYLLRGPFGRAGRILVFYRTTKSSRGYKSTIASGEANRQRDKKYLKH